MIQHCIMIYICDFCYTSGKGKTIITMAIRKRIKEAFDVLQLLSTFALIYLFSSVIQNAAPFEIKGESFIDVDTSQIVHLEKSTRAEVPCRVDYDVDLVYWSKRISDQTLGLVVLWDFTLTPPVKVGPGYVDGSNDIDGNYSLIFYDVEIVDEGLYICEVVNFDIAGFYRNRTDVNVYASPREPYPTIKECIKENTMDTEQNCTMKAYSANITCFVEEYYPNTTLSFHHGDNETKDVQTFETKNVDGSFNKSIVANLSPSDEPYFCVAADVPGYLANRTAKITILPPPPPTDGPGSSGPNLAAILSPVLIALVCIAFLAIIFVVRSKRQGAANITTGNKYPHNRDL